MSLNQYAVFQLKVDDSTRPLRNKSYKHVLEKHITVVSDNYIQVYQTPMILDTSPEEIRGQLEKKLPSKFKGHALDVSDVIAITKEGVTSAYYVDIKGVDPDSGLLSHELVHSYDYDGDERICL